MVNLPIVLIVMEKGKRAADINAGGSFHAYSYTKKYTKCKERAVLRDLFGGMLRDLYFI